jgi:hypothetical protein
MMKHIETILIKHRFNYIEQKVVRQGKNIFFYGKKLKPLSGGAKNLNNPYFRAARQEPVLSKSAIREGVTPLHPSISIRLTFVSLIS